MDEIRLSSLFSLQTSSSRCFPATKRNLNLLTMITKNRADFIIALMGNSIKASKLELGIYSLLQLWGFKGERLRLEPVPHYSDYKQIRKDSQ